MAFDYKKEYKEYYAPPKEPTIISVPKMNFIAVRGKGDPNEEAGEYARAMDQLYGVAYTIKMSYKGPHKIEGFFEYVVPPLEGLWWQDGVEGFDYTRKNEFQWISMIRLPDFVNESDFDWAVEEATNKKKADYSGATYYTYEEGCCVQCMHIGSYDDEPATIQKMNEYATNNGYVLDISSIRRHHEIYLSDPRKTETSKLKTIIRHPIKKA